MHPGTRDECCTFLHLAKAATIARIVLNTATKSEVWWLIWLTKCPEWEINSIQDPSTTNTANYLVALPVKYAQRELPQLENCADLEMWKLPYMPLVRWLPLLGPNHANPCHSPGRDKTTTVVLDWPSKAKKIKLPTHKKYFTTFLV